MQRARLKDIAEKVGCSIAVVSHVVNNSSGNITCRQELRERIATLEAIVIEEEKRRPFKHL